MSTSATMNRPSEGAWLGAVAEAMDRLSDMFDPIRHSLALESGRLDPTTIEEARTFAKRCMAEFEQAADANPAFVPWKSEFEFATQHKYLLETLDAPGPKSNIPLVIEGLRTGNIAMLVQWSVENNPEARQALETAAGSAREGRNEGREAARVDPKDEQSDRNYRVPVDPRSLAPTAGRALETDEEHEPQRANVRRSVLNRQIAVAADLTARDQPNTSPRPGNAPARATRGPVRSALPPAPNQTPGGPNRGDLGR
jgi:hypothetical protein